MEKKKVIISVSMLAFFVISTSIIYALNEFQELDYFVKRVNKVSYVSEKASGRIVSLFNSSHPNEIVLCLFGEINGTGLFVERIDVPKLTFRNETYTNFMNTCSKDPEFIGLIHNHPGVVNGWCPWTLSSMDVKNQKKNKVIGLICPDYTVAEFFVMQDQKHFLLYEFNLLWWENEGAIFTE